MKFTIINDLHVGPPQAGYHKGVRRKLIHKSEDLIKEFVRRMNIEEHPDFVVNLGDSIEDIRDKEVDFASYKKCISLLSALTMPVYHLIGNHDIRTISQEEISSILGYKRMYYSFESNNFHFVALSFVMTEDHLHDVSAISARLPDEQLQWLTEDLKKAIKPVVLFIHYGLAEDDMKGNFWFESNPHHALLENRGNVRAILERSGKVRAVFSAHQHWNKMHVHNMIPYFTVTSLVENTNNDGKASEAHTIVIIDDKNIRVEVRGNDPALFEHSFKA